MFRVSVQFNLCLFASWFHPETKKEKNSIMWISCMGLGSVNWSQCDTNFDLASMSYLVTKVIFRVGYLIQSTQGKTLCGFDVLHCFIWKNEHNAPFKWTRLLGFVNDWFHGSIISLWSLIIYFRLLATKWM